MITDERPPLHRAALDGDLDRVQALIQSGISTISLDSRRNLPIHLAAVSGNAEVIKVLIEHYPRGVRVNEDLYQGPYSMNIPKNIYGNTPLHLVMRNGSAEAIELLLKESFKGDPKRDFPEIAILQLNNNGETPLHIAAKHANLDGIDKIAAHEKSIRISEPPLDKIRYREIENAPYLFIPNHAHSYFWVCDNTGKTPVEVAITHGRTEATDKLIYVEKDRCSDYMRRLFDLAFIEKQSDIMHLLIQKYNTRTPLHCAIADGDITRAKELIVNGIVTDGIEINDAMLVAFIDGLEKAKEVIPLAMTCLTFCNGLALPISGLTLSEGNPAVRVAYTDEEVEMLGEKEASWRSRLNLEEDASPHLPDVACGKLQMVGVPTDSMLLVTSFLDGKTPNDRVANITEYQSLSRG